MSNQTEMNAYWAGYEAGKQELENSDGFGWTPTKERMQILNQLADATGNAEEWWSGFNTAIIERSEG